jgi:Gpi18-like mannosyltransferase
MAEFGPGHFYSEMEPVDYPPGYLFVLWPLGEVSKGIASATYGDAFKIAQSLVKIPPILLDVGVGLLLYRIVWTWPIRSLRSESTALMAAALYILNPVTLYDSAIWGQTDAAGAFIVLLGMIALIQWPSEIVAAIAALAALIKPQFGVILAPLVLTLLLKRHLLVPADSSGDSSRISAYWLRWDGPIRILTAAITGLATFYIVVTPFNLNLQTFLERMTATAQQYPYLSVNAFNPWALAGSDRAPLAFLGIDMVSRDDIPLIGPISGMMIGTALLAVGFLIGAVRLFWRSDPKSLALVGGYLCMCFFVLPTRVHERYLFPALAFLALLAAFDRRWLWATTALTLGSLLNLHAVLTTDDAPNRIAWSFAKFFQSQTVILTSITLNTAVFLFAAWQLRPQVSQAVRTETE